MEHTGLRMNSYRVPYTHLRGWQLLYSVNCFDLKAPGDCHSGLLVGCCMWVDLNEVVNLLLGCVPQMSWL